MKKSGDDSKAFKIKNDRAPSNALPLANEPPLELPEGPGLSSDDAMLSLEEHWMLCEKMLPIWNAERNKFPERSCPVKEQFTYR
jgi:hypothetical protein